jgi:hypothetical protein
LNDDFVVGFGCNSMETLEPKIPKPRTSGDEFMEQTLSLTLSLKLKTELRKLHAECGSRFNWVSF